MTKDELYKSVAADTGLKKKDVEAVVGAMTYCLLSELKAGRGFVLPDIAKFSVKEKPATPTRTVRTPSGGTSVITAKPAHNVVRVKPVKSLRDAVRKGA